MFLLALLTLSKGGFVWDDVPAARDVDCDSDEAWDCVECIPCLDTPDATECAYCHTCDIYIECLSGRGVDHYLAPAARSEGKKPDCKSTTAKDCVECLPCLGKTTQECAYCHDKCDEYIDCAHLQRGVDHYLAPAARTGGFFNLPWRYQVGKPDVGRSVPTARNPYRYKYASGGKTWNRMDGPGISRSSVDDYRSVDDKLERELRAILDGLLRARDSRDPGLRRMTGEENPVWGQAPGAPEV